MKKLEKFEFTDIFCWDNFKYALVNGYMIFGMNCSCIMLRVLASFLYYQPLNNNAIQLKQLN